LFDVNANNMYIGN